MSPSARPVPVSDPDALKESVDRALPFLGFRLNQVLNSRQLRSPEDRARMAQEAMAIVAEHPDQNVQKLYAGQVAAHVGLKCVLVQESWVDWPDSVYDKVGNILLSRLAGADVRLVQGLTRRVQEADVTELATRCMAP